MPLSLHGAIILLRLNLHGEDLMKEILKLRFRHFADDKEILENMRTAKGSVRIDRSYLVHEVDWFSLIMLRDGAMTYRWIGQNEEIPDVKKRLDEIGYHEIDTAVVRALIERTGMTLH